VGACFELRISLSHSMQRQHKPEIFSGQPHRTLARLSLHPLCLSRELFKVMGALQQHQQKLCAISKQTPTSARSHPTFEKLHPLFASCYGTIRQAPHDPDRSSSLLQPPASFFPIYPTAPLRPSDPAPDFLSFPGHWEDRPVRSF
jgi:hypothetical protein